jgi:hypothetical protein
MNKDKIIEKIKKLSIVNKAENTCVHNKYLPITLNLVKIEDVIAILEQDENVNIGSAEEFRKTWLEHNPNIVHIPSEHELGLMEAYANYFSSQSQPKLSDEEIEKWAEYCADKSINDFDTKIIIKAALMLGVNWYKEQIKPKQST